jgi:RNA polymerase sigma-70 factor (ECF subfamily)
MENRAADSDVSSGELLRRYVERADEAAFAEVTRRSGALVHGICRRVLGNGGDSEEVVQSVFALMARRASRLCERDEPGVRAWLSAVALRLATNRLRSVIRRRRREGAAAPEPGTTTVSDHNLRDEVEEALAELPAAMREVISARYLRGLSHLEIGRQFGVSAGAARERLHRAMGEIRRRLRGKSPVVAAGSAVLVFGRARRAWATSLLAGTAAVVIALWALGRVPHARRGDALLEPGVVEQSLQRSVPGASTTQPGRGAVFAAEMSRQGFGERPPRRTVAADVNGFYHVERMAGAFSPVEEAMHSANSGSFGWYMEAKSEHATGSQDWDQEFAKSFIDACTPAQECFDLALTAPEFQFPEAGLADSVWFLFRAQDFCVYLKRVEAEFALRSGDSARAIEVLLESMALGKRFQAGEGNGLHYMVGMTIQSLALQKLMGYLEDGRLELGDEELNGVAMLIGQLAPDRSDFESAVQQERALVVDSIQAAFEGDAGALVGIAARWKPREGAALWDPETAREKLDNIDPAGLARSLAMAWRREDADDGRANSTPASVRSDEAHEDTLAHELADSAGLWTERHRTTFLCTAAAMQISRTWIAAKRARAAGHTLAGIEHLAPEFLPEVPADPFDGEPLRFDGATGLVWSVGTDRIDSGGEVDPGREGPFRDRSELVMRLR